VLCGSLAALLSCHPAAQPAEVHVLVSILYLRSVSVLLVRTNCCLFVTPTPPSVTTFGDEDDTSQRLTSTSRLYTTSTCSCCMWHLHRDFRLVSTNSLRPLCSVVNSELNSHLIVLTHKCYSCRLDLFNCNQRTPHVVCMYSNSVLRAFIASVQ